MGELEDKIDRFFRGLFQILFVLFQLALIGLKLSGAMDISWLFVLGPVLILLGSILFIFVVMGLVIAIVRIKEGSWP